MLQRSISARWIVYARRELLQIADAILPPNAPRPLAFVQIRMTDKGNEDPFFRKYKRYHTVRDYLDVLTKVCCIVR